MWGRISIFLVAALVASLVAGVWFGQVLSRNAPLNPGAQLEDERAMRQAIGGDTALRVPEPPQPRVDGTIGVPVRAHMDESVQLVSAAEASDSEISITTEQYTQKGTDPLAALIQSRILGDAQEGDAAPPNVQANAPAGGSVYRINDPGAAPAAAHQAPSPGSGSASSNVQAPWGAGGSGAPPGGMPGSGMAAGTTRTSDGSLVANSQAGSGQAPQGAPRARITREQLPPDLAFAVAQPSETPTDLPALATTPAQPAPIPSPAIRAQGPGAAGWQSALRTSLSQCDSLREPGRSECMYRARVDYCNTNNGWGQVQECPAAARPR